MAVIRRFRTAGGRDRHDDLGLPQLRRVEVTIDPAEQATLFSLPVVIVPAVPKRIHLAERLHVKKLAGTLWSTAGSGVLGLRFAAPGSFQMAMFNQAIVDNFFGADEDVWVAPDGAGSSSGLGWTTGTAGSNGTALTLALASADISGGTGKLIVNCWYRSWPGIGADFQRAA